MTYLLQLRSDFNVLLNVFQFPFPWKGFEIHLYTTLHRQRTVQETMMAMVAFSNQV